MSKGIQSIFTAIPRTYELVNHVLTFGLDILWRKRALKSILPQEEGRWLDVCSGTGEMAVNLSKRAGRKAVVYAADFSQPMISVAQAKSNAGKIRFLLADLKKMPLTDNTFDLITISFATRNLNVNRDVLIHCFQELYRIIKPGGVFINVETSQPDSTFIKKLFHWYIKLFVAWVGRLISGSAAGYTYLSKTIPRFYPAPQLADIMKTAGFQNVTYEKLFYGVAAIHTGNKWDNGENPVRIGKDG